MIAHCGKQKHWHHREGVCDPWYRPSEMTDWHIGWQSLCRPEHVKVPIKPHRADICLPDGCVIKVQHSPIGAEEVAEREAFYPART